MVHDTDRPAELTIWPRATPARTARSRSFTTLQAALEAAAEALAADDVQAWIITEDGKILSPNWIEAHLRSDAKAPSRSSA